MRSDNRRPLPPTGEAMWSVIQTLGGWFTRQQLAEALGKRQLSPWDKELLGRLVALRRLEVQEQQEKNFVRLVYRVPGEWA